MKRNDIEITDNKEFFEYGYKVEHTSTKNKLVDFKIKGK